MRGGSNGHLIGKLDEAAGVGRGGGLAVAHVDEVGLVLDDSYERPRQTHPGLHGAQPAVANLAGDDLRACAHSSTFSASVPGGQQSALVQLQIKRSTAHIH